MSHAKPRDLLVILRRGPHGSSQLREGLDTALVAAAFGRTVTLLFMGEGVTALVADQKAGPLGQKGTAATLEMLEMYDIDRLLVEASALEQFGLGEEDLMLEATAVSQASIALEPASHRLVLVF